MARYGTVDVPQLGLAADPQRIRSLWWMKALEMQSVLRGSLLGVPHCVELISLPSFLVGNVTRLNNVIGKVWSRGDSGDEQKARSGRLGGVVKALKAFTRGRKPPLVESRERAAGFSF